MPWRSSLLRKGPVFVGLGVAAILLTVLGPARAGDEIQLYDASIAEVGQWTIQHHFNYTFNGRKEPDFPGGLVPNHALNATPEFAYGVTDWFEFGFYIPWAVDGGGRFLSNAAKVRALFVTPEEAKRTFWYGLNFEFDFPTKQFAQTPSMVDGRWYGTATTLGDGRVMAFSGLNLSGVTNNTVEIYDLRNGGASWSSPRSWSPAPRSRTAFTKRSYIRLNR